MDRRKYLRDRMWAGTALAAMLAASPALAAQLPNFTGPQDPSQLLYNLNQLIQTLNVSLGMFQPQTIPTGNPSDTSTDTLQTIIVPANFFTGGGQRLRFRASGVLATSAANKTVAVTFGSISCSAVLTGTVAWEAGLEVMHVGSNSQTYSGYVVKSAASPTLCQGTAAISESLSTGITATITGRTDTASASDVVANYFAGEILK